LTEELSIALARLDGVKLVGSRDICLANTVSCVVRGADSLSLLAGLDIEGICASSGSACSSGALTPSHVISALGYESDLAKALVRFSLGRGSTPADVAYTAEILPKVISRSQAGQQHANSL
jgi:cysteine desulfurase